MNDTTAAPESPATREDVTSKRIVAAFIDMGVSIALFVVVAMIFGDSGSDGDEGGFSVSLNGIGFWIFLAFWFLYFFVLEMISGQTLGKKIVGIKVVTLSGAMVSPGKSALRTICRLVDWLPLFYLVGFIVMSTSKQKQRIGDLAAGTIVVKA